MGDVHRYSAEFQDDVTGYDPSPISGAVLRIIRQLPDSTLIARKLADIVPALVPFVSDDVTYDAAAVAKHLTGDGIAAHLAAWRDVVLTLPALEPVATEAALRQLAETRGIKPGILIHGTRVAVVGQAVSPGLFEVLELVGRDRVTERLRTAAS